MADEKSLELRTGEGFTRVATEFKTVRAEIAAKAETSDTTVAALTKRVDSAETRLTTAETTLAKKAEINDAKASTTTAYSGAKVDDVVTTAKQAVKDELLGGAGSAFDTLKELGDLITTNKDAIAALQTIAGNHVRYDGAQSLTDAQKKQARDNVAAASAADLTAGLAKKLNATVLKTGETVALDAITAEGEYIVTSPTGLPTGFTADPAFVSVRRSGTVAVQTVGGAMNDNYRLFGRTGTITPAAGEPPESVKWSAFSEIGRIPDLSGYATKAEVAAVKTTAEAAKSAAAANATSITALQGTVSGHTTAIQKNANDIAALQKAVGDPTDFVATFEAALK